MISAERKRPLVSRHTLPFSSVTRFGDLRIALQALVEMSSRTVALALLETLIQGVFGDMIACCSISGQFEIHTTNQIRDSMFGVISGSHLGLCQLDGVGSIIPNCLSGLDEVRGRRVSAWYYACPKIPGFDSIECFERGNGSSRGVLCGVQGILNFRQQGVSVHYRHVEAAAAGSAHRPRQSMPEAPLVPESALVTQLFSLPVSVWRDPQDVAKTL